MSKRNSGEVHGTARLSHQGKLLTITRNKKAKRYLVVQFRSDTEMIDVAYRLIKDDGDSYTIAHHRKGYCCSCADAEFRKRTCKHLAAAIAVGLLPKEAKDAGVDDAKG